MNSHPRPRVGVSACLLGQPVRYDGGHKRDSFIADTLNEYLELLPVCPEAAIGLGVPRPAIRLLGESRRPRLVGVQDPSMDVTEKMENFAKQQAEALGDLCGYILKKDSPSCGMQRVKLFSPEGGGAVRKGTGVFAAIFMQRHPLLPVEEEGRLNDPLLRENFINRVYVMLRWRNLQRQGLSAARLLEFHTAHKYLVMAHSQAAYRRMGARLSDLSGKGLETTARYYFEELMNALARRITRPRHVNVLQHILGYLKRRIDRDDKAELSASIEAYRRGEIPLVVPVTLLRHYFRRHREPYMEKQVYLNPHPEGLGLRNAI